LDLGGLMIVAFSVGLVYTFEFVGASFHFSSGCFVSVRRIRSLVVECMAWACMFDFL
jgi:hypothetical protein